MFNTIPLDEPSLTNFANKFVYFKQNFTYQSTAQHEPVKVLVNPNFKKKVFVNPNFNGGNFSLPTALPKIHINPNKPNLKLDTGVKESNKIHINPNVLRNIPVSLNSSVKESCSKNTVQKCNDNGLSRTIISTRTKLIRSTTKNTCEDKIKKRRTSVRSQFKIIKSSLLKKSIGNENIMTSKYKLIKPYFSYAQYSKKSKPVQNKFKVDNRGSKPVGMSLKNKKYVYINRFLGVSDIPRRNLLKTSRSRLCLVDTEGNTRKMSLNCIRKTSNIYKKTNNIKIIIEKPICKSKYKIVKKFLNHSATNSQILKQSKISSAKFSVGKNRLKLRVCNIPCPYYRKFGRCKGKENGKCCRKHDPDQIALCTKFLQGACVDNKCLLSHNVSPEKMPTCKFYLEGSCSRDDCPYLHVRINPKADICKDFLEGFCKKAAQCDKRHQYLCPDYEKNGNCLKQRCPYPHGKMVRKYSVFNKNKFAKKSSNDPTNEVKTEENAVEHKIQYSKSKNLDLESCKATTKSRYYVDQNNLNNEEKININQNNSDQENNERCGLRSRPKLGILPSFIAFENI